MSEELRLDRFTIQRIGALLHQIHPIKDSTGKVVQYLAKPLKVELRRRDLAQILVGASILSIPVGFTEEVWQLGELLPVANILALAATSLAFIGLYVHFTFYRELLGSYRFEYIKRVAAIYVLSLLIVAGLLTLIQVAPWTTEPLVALKRVVIVAFPASMSAALSDSIS